MRLTATATTRPKWARVHTRTDREELYVALMVALDSFIEAGTDWAELDGWQSAFSSAEVARARLSRLVSGGAVAVHRVGDSIYLRRRWEC